MTHILMIRVWLEVAYSEHAYKQAYVDIEQNYPEFRAR